MRCDKLRLGSWFSCHLADLLFHSGNLKSTILNYETSKSNSLVVASKIPLLMDKPSKPQGLKKERQRERERNRESQRKKEIYIKTKEREKAKQTKRESVCVYVSLFN